MYDRLTIVAIIWIGVGALVLLGLLLLWLRRYRGPRHPSANGHEADSGLGWGGSEDGPGSGEGRGPKGGDGGGD